MHYWRVRASLTGPNPRDAGASKNGKDIVGTSKGCRCGGMGFRRFIKRKERRQKSNGGKKKVDFNGEFYDSKILKLFRGEKKNFQRELYTCIDDIDLCCGPRKK